MTDLCIYSPVNGKRALVSNNNQLHTLSETRIALHSYADRRAAYIFSMPPRTLPGTSEYMMMWFAPTDTARHAHVERVIYSWNGGSTNHNRVMTVRLYIGTPAPSANAVAFSPGNMWIGDLTPAEGSYYQWNTVGNGMTVASNGVFATGSMYSQGQTPYVFDGGMVIPNGVSVGLTVQGEEEGDFAISVIGFFEGMHNE